MRFSSSSSWSLRSAFTGSAPDPASRPARVPFAPGVFKHVISQKMHLFQILPGRRKFLLRLARKAHDHVGGDGGIVKASRKIPQRSRYSSVL